MVPLSRESLPAFALTSVAIGVVIFGDRVTQNTPAPLLGCILYAVVDSHAVEQSLGHFKGHFTSNRVL
jgi:cytochrome bd-type quinol oxidase subunit 1